MTSQPFPDDSTYVHVKVPVDYVVIPKDPENHCVCLKVCNVFVDSNDTFHYRISVFLLKRRPQQIRSWLWIMEFGFADMGTKEIELILIPFIYKTNFLQGVFRCWWSNLSICSDNYDAYKNFFVAIFLLRLFLSFLCVSNFIFVLKLCMWWVITAWVVYFEQQILQTKG